MTLVTTTLSNNVKVKYLYHTEIPYKVLTWYYAMKDIIKHSFNGERVE